MTQQITHPKIIRKKTRSNANRLLFQNHFGKPLEEYEAYKRSIEGLKQGTIKNYQKDLPKFFIYLNEDPDTVINNRLADIAGNAIQAERYERRIKTYIKILEKKGVTVRAPLGVIYGFFSNNGKRLALDLSNIKISKARKRRKYSPSNEDVRKLYSQTDKAQGRFIISVAYQNGALPVDLEGLKIGDYPEEPWQYFEISRGKNGEVLRGISTPDACRSLKEYMLIRKGKVKQPLLLSREDTKMGADDIGMVIKSAIEKAELDGIKGFTPKCLRDGFEDALADAEIYHKVKEALMGHTVDIEHQYGGFNKMVERLTQAMKKVYPLICLTEVQKDIASNVDQERLKRLLDNFDVFMELAELQKQGRLEVK